MKLISILLGLIMATQIVSAQIIDNYGVRLGVSVANES